MTLSNRGDYVVRSAICLAKAFDAGTSVKLREVVSDTSVPATYASQILGDLVRAGLASSKAGRDGGYRLVRSPGEISVLEVVESAEGPLRAERCALGEGPCRWEAVCPMHDTWTAATAALRETLAATMLAHLAERDLELSRSGFVVPADSHRAPPRAGRRA
ncbi:MAG: RrF2 family transcriptional regulator [Acidimicrobiales bacterium]